MDKSNSKQNSMDEYISGFPESTGKILKELRTEIKRLAPNAEEAMRYGIPTFRLNGNLVHFAAYKSHIGFYPGPSGIDAFKKDISKYKSSKGAIQFPIDKPMPLELIKKIVKYRIKENLEKK